MAKKRFFLYDKFLDLLQNIGGKVSRDFLVDLIMKGKGNIRICFEKNGIRIKSEGLSFSIKDKTRKNKNILSLEFPLNLKINLNDIIIPLNFDGEFK